MTPWTGFTVGLYIAIGWLFARQVQKETTLNPQQFNGAILLLSLMFLWPLAVMCMIVVLSATVLFPKIKNKK